MVSKTCADVPSDISGFVCN